MNDIRNWFMNGAPYEAGVALYQQYGHNALLKKLFQEGYSPFKEAKLRQAMNALIATGTAPGAPLQQQADDLAPVVALQPENSEPEKRPEVPGKASNNRPLQPILPPRGWPAQMDAAVLALYNRWKPLFAEKKNLQSRIYDVAVAGRTHPEKKKEAGAMAHRILDLRDACRDIYQQRDTYLATGKLPQEQSPLDIPDDPKRQPLTLANWQRYIRDYKNKLKKAPQNEDFKKQLAKYEWGVAELKKMLGY